LAELLKKQELPENYKVAVVGRFKTGKSSFVNELLGARLASEDTNPETAAITTFRHGPRVKATVRFVPRRSGSSCRSCTPTTPSTSTLTG
jgi:GTP-binding protein EngB required for normal cell division